MPRQSRSLDATPLTRVSLAFIVQRNNLYLRFGHPVRELRLNRWQLMVLKAESEQQVQPVLPQIDAIEALGIDPVTVSPAYWRTLGNRLSARLARAC